MVAEMNEPAGPRNAPLPEPVPFSGVMEKLRRGDPEAARDVFDRFARRLVGMAATKLPAFSRAKVDPEDIVQSVFRTFFRRVSAGEFTPEHWDALWSLLAVITARKCGHQIGHLVASRRDARRDLAADVAASDSVDWEPTDPTPTPAEATLLAETLGVMLADLTERERTVVVLRLQGYSIIEIAEKASSSERSVHRILAAVRSRLEHLAVG